MCLKKIASRTILSNILKSKSVKISEILLNEPELFKMLNSKIDIESVLTNKIDENSKYDGIINTISESANEVYNNLSWGYQESVYREALAQELRSRNIDCKVEIPITLKYKDEVLSYSGSRIDILVDNNIILELKADSLSANTINKAKRQCMRYLEQTGYKMGMIVGFPDKCDKTVVIEKIITIGNDYRISR